MTAPSRKTAITTYRLYQLSGRPIFAVPVAPRRLRLAGIARYQPFTLKHAVYRGVMTLAMRLGADRLLGKTVDQPVEPDGDFRFDDWLDQVRGELEDDGLCAVVFWPPQTTRRRVYVHLFDAAQRPIGFAKISLDEQNDGLLLRESEILAELSEAGLRTCRVPRVLAVGESGSAGHRWLVTEPLPEHARPLGHRQSAYPSSMVEEFSGARRQVPPEALPRLSWWPDYQASLSSDTLGFARELETLADDEGVAVCRVHGDFGLPNMVIEGDGTPWVFDWEQSRPDGPVLADEVSFVLTLDLARTLADPLPALRRFHDRFLSTASPTRRCQIMMALAFRHAAGVGDAGLFMRNWAHEGRTMA